ncbi:MAG: tetratricopeptide repeat protein [Candidatus Obscuribacterales bacterium]|nr:tetratricopeptide repeat protein [Candidatus Obscuribacterales bacterium]
MTGRFPLRVSFALLSLSILLSAAAPAQAASKQGAKATISNSTVKRQAEPAFRDRLFKGKLSVDSAKGEQALLNGKVNDAAAAFRSALNKNSKDVSALCGLGFALAIQFKLDGADEQFNKAVKVDPNFPLAHVGKAFVTLNRLQSSSMTIIKQRPSMLSQAESECRRALQKDPGLPEALVVLGMVQKEQGRLSEAQSSFTQAIKGDPKYSQAFSQRGVVELQQNNLAAAASDFQDAIRLRSSNSTAHFGLGRVYLAQGNADAALKSLNTALYLNPNSAPVQIALGDAYRMQKNYNAAIAAYQKAILIKSENEAAYINLSDIREERGDLELALAELRGGIELNPNSLPLHLRIGDICLKLEKTDDAIKEYTTCMQLYPGSVEAAKGMTRAYVLKAEKEANGAFFLSNNYEAAEAMIQQAIRMNPNDMELRLVDAKFRSMSGKTVDLNSLGTPTNDPERIAYAEALTAQFRYDEAAQMMNTVLNNTTDAKQLLAIGDISVMNRDLDSAFAAYTKAAALPDASARAKRGIDAVAKARDSAQKELTFANDLARKKQLASAIDNYRNAAYLNPRLADAHYGLAEALKKFFSKNPQSLREAAQHLRAYISLSPNLPEKEKEKITKEAEKLVEKAYKIERKQAVQD